MGFAILVPIYGLINGFPSANPTNLIGIEEYGAIWNSQIRYVGVGAMVVGGVYTLWSMRKTIIEGLSQSFKKSSSDKEVLRTEMDLPMDKVVMVCGILVGLIFLFYWYATGSITMALAGALFLGVVSFFFAAVAGYIAGVVGSSNSPVSGMTIATLLFTIGLVWVVGGLILNMEEKEMMIATMFIAAIVATSAEKEEELREISALTLSGTLDYQACDDAICYLPVSVPVTFTLEFDHLDYQRANPRPNR